MAEEFEEGKWEGKVSIEVRGIEGEIVWHVLEDFCNLHKWTQLDTCYKVEGIEGQIGLIRFCGSTKKRIAEDVEPTINWATEKLLKIDPIQRCMSYEIVDNNMGFTSYVATVKVLSLLKYICGDGKSLGCMIEWECVCDPVEGWTLQDLNYFVGSIFRSMANNIEITYYSTS